MSRPEKPAVSTERPTMAKRYHGAGSDYENKRAMEKKDGNMMPSGKNEHACLPTEVVMRDYPRVDNYMVGNYDDTMVGMDRQMSEDASQRRKGTKPRKA